MIPIGYENQGDYYCEEADEGEHRDANDRGEKITLAPKGAPVAVEQSAYHTFRSQRYKQGQHDKPR